MSPSEIAFLALGLVLGAAIGGAIVEAVRARPAPRREVRITVSPNSIRPRRPVTLASADLDAGREVIPGSPDDDGWLERRLAGEPTLPPNRTRVPSGPVTLPAGAVGVPVEGPLSAPARGSAGGTGRSVPGPGRGPDAATASLRAATAVAVLERGEAPDTDPERPGAARLPSRIDQGPVRPATVVRPRSPVPAPRISLPAQVAALPMERPRAAGDRSAASTPGGGSGSAAGPSAPGPAAAGQRSCEAEERLVTERCSLADVAREQARLAADTLRDAQRGYDVLRERVDRAQSIADPREIRAAKDGLHRAFRTARAAATTTEAAEQAARDWLTEINRLNLAARDAAHVVESGNAELRAVLPRLERLAVEADAARIAAEGADAGCREAREALARCEEQAARAAAAAAAAAAGEPEEPTARDLAWPTTHEEAPVAEEPAAGQQVGELAAITRILRGDRGARERLIASLSSGDVTGTRDWQLRISGLVDAIVARAIEDGFLDLPDTGFWGLFTHRERREIVAALSALGFRYDGMGGFSDDRLPAQRDLSLAVGYAGLDRMRIRMWPRESELGGLYAEATVAADEWLASEASDLMLGRMVDALGGRAAELADVWNAWGRIRPGLLAAD